MYIAVKLGLDSMSRRIPSTVKEVIVLPSVVNGLRLPRMECIEIS